MQFGKYLYLYSYLSLQYIYFLKSVCVWEREREQTADI